MRICSLCILDLHLNLPLIILIPGELTPSAAILFPLFWNLVLSKDVVSAISTTCLLIGKYATYILVPARKGKAGLEKRKIAHIFKALTHLPTERSLEKCTILLTLLCIFLGSCIAACTAVRCSFGLMPTIIALHLPQNP